MSNAADATQPTELSWEYVGESNATHGASLQVAKPGDVLEHDVFGLCTLLSEPCADAGSFMVVLHSDNHIKELTRGHFQFHSSRLSVRAANSGGTAPAETEVSAQPANPTAQANTEQQPPSLSDVPDGVGSSSTDEEAGQPVLEGDEKKPEAEGNAADDANVSDNDGKDDLDADKTDNAADEEPAIFKLVVAAMQKQCQEYELDPRGMELTFFKSLVLMDTSGIKPPGSDGENCGIRVGQYVRERSTGYFFVVCRIYKPLLGFLVDRTDGVTAAEGGEQRTLQVAKMSRMLGGNTGYFSGNVHSVLIVLQNVKFDVVWLSCETPNLASVFDLSPSMSDVAHAAGEQDYQKYAADVVEKYADVYHRSDPSVPGGGTAIKESFLRGTTHVATLFKRWRSKPYLTASEAETQKAEAAKAAEAKKAAYTAKKKAADEAKAVAAQQRKEGQKSRKAQAAVDTAAAARKTNKRNVGPIIVDDESDDDDDDDDDDVDVEEEEVRKGDDIEEIENAVSNKRACQQPAAKRQPTRKARSAKEPAEKLAGCERTTGTALPANVSTGAVKHQYVYEEELMQKSFRTQQLPLMGSNVSNIDDAAAAALKNMSGVASEEAANAQGANTQTTNAQAADAQGANAQATNAQASNAQALNAQALAMQAAMQASMLAMQNPFMQAFQQFAFAPQAIPFVQMQAGWPGMSFALPPATPASTGQPASSGSTSPSLLAIQARVNYQNKRERDLNEAQALFEYHQEKQERRRS